MEKRKGKQRGIRRDRDCLTCKARGVKCDLNRPSCKPCLQAGLSCAGYVQRVVWTENRDSGQSQTNTATNNGVASDPATSPVEAQLPLTPVHSHTSSLEDVKFETFNWTNNQYRFLRWITAYYDRAKSTQSDSDRLHAPGETFALVSRVWNYAWTHLHGYLDGSNYDSIDSMHHHVTAIVGLNEAIKDAHLVAIFGIATFAYFDVCEGPFGEWHCHLQGARSLLDLHCRDATELEILSREITGLKEIIAHLCWFDTMGAIINGSRPLIFEDWHRETMNYTFFALVGCPPDTFDLYVALAKLELAEEPQDLKFQAMNQLLRYHSDTTDELSLTENSWRAAAVIAFASKVGDRSSSPRRDLLDSCMDRASDGIESVPVSSGFYMHLAATAYLAGLNAKTARHRNIIRGYWGNCRSYTFPYYPDAQAQCEERWQRADLEPV